MAEPLNLCLTCMGTREIFTVHFCSRRRMIVSPLLPCTACQPATHRLPEPSSVVLIFPASAQSDPNLVIDTEKSTIEYMVDYCSRIRSPWRAP